MARHGTTGSCFCTFCTALNELLHTCEYAAQCARNSRGCLVRFWHDCEKVSSTWWKYFCSLRLTQDILLLPHIYIQVYITNTCHNPNTLRHVRIKMKAKKTKLSCRSSPNNSYTECIYVLVFTPVQTGGRLIGEAVAREPHKVRIWHEME
jgi:hypothetical protein